MHGFKSLFLFFVLVLLPVSSFAQETETIHRNISLGLNIAPIGKYDIFYISDEHGPRFSTNSFYSVGIVSYFRKWEQPKKHGHSGIEVGLNYTHHQFKVTETSDNYYPTHENINLVEIPVYFRAETKYIYVSTGIILSAEMQNSGFVSNRTGLGFGGSIGFGIDIKNKAYFFIGPGLSVNSLINFGADSFAPLLGINGITGFRFYL